MTNLIKMEWYKLRTSKLFIIMAFVIFGLNFIITACAPLLASTLSPGFVPDPTNLSSLLSSPFSLGLLMIPIFISAVSFMYLDFSGGYVKNIAGQLNNRGSMVIAKFIIIAIHNLIFFLIGVLSVFAGTLATGQVVFDANILGGVLTLLLKWLLSVSLCSILMFFAVGVQNKTISVIFSVVFSNNTLSLLYMGLNTLCSDILKLGAVNVGDYMPDGLMNSVNAIDGTLTVNAIIVSVVFIALFVTLTYIIFKKRDVK